MSDKIIADDRFACWAGRVFDGERTLADHAVLIENGKVSAVVPRRAVPSDIPLRYEPDCTIIPGLIDTHTDGGFGLVFSTLRHLEL